MIGVGFCRKEPRAGGAGGGGEKELIELTPQGIVRSTDLSENISNWSCVIMAPSDDCSPRQLGEGEGLNL